MTNRKKKFIKLGIHDRQYNAIAMSSAITGDAVSIFEPHCYRVAQYYLFQQLGLPECEAGYGGTL